MIYFKLPECTNFAFRKDDNSVAVHFIDLSCAIDLRTEFL